MTKKPLSYLKNLHFLVPKTIDFIIFDHTNAEPLATVIPDNSSRVIFKTRPVQLNLNPKILARFILNLKYFDLTRCFGSKRGFGYRFFWQMLMLYIKADIEIREPKAIITFIDNCPKFAWLSERLKDIPCIAVQNGFRLSYAANLEYKYYCQYLFCFGEQQAEQFPKLGYKVDHYYPVGSLFLSNSIEMSHDKTYPKYDLLIVSCWRGNIGFQQDVDDSMKSMRFMDVMLSRYLGKRDLKAAVILRTERDSFDWIMPEVGMSEENYYKSIYGDKVEIIETEFSERNIYTTMQSSDLIVAGFGTTCLIEAFSIGKKILYANFCGTDKYHVDFCPEIVFSGTDEDYSLFEARLDKLTTITERDFEKKYKKMMGYYASDPRMVSVQRKVKDQISRILEQR